MFFKLVTHEKESEELDFERGRTYKRVPVTSARHVHILNM